MRRRMVGRSTWAWSAPTRNNSANPWIEVMGVRSSCEASARNWRRRCSVTSRSRKASSMSSSMVLRASPSCPTSVGPPEGLTRCVRSPAVMAPAVADIASSGCRPRRRMSHDPALRAASSASGGGHLDEDELIQRRGHVAQGHGHHDGVVAVGGGGAGDHDPPLTRPADRSGGEEPLGARGRVQVVGQVGLGGGVDHLDARLHGAALVAQLGVGVGREVHGPLAVLVARSTAREELVGRPEPARAAVGARAGGGGGRGGGRARLGRARRGPVGQQLHGHGVHRRGDLVVQALVLGPGIEGVGGEPEDGQAHRQQHHQGQHQPQAQGHRRTPIDGVLAGWGMDLDRGSREPLRAGIMRRRSGRPLGAAGGGGDHRG